MAVAAAAASSFWRDFSALSSQSTELRDGEDEATDDLDLLLLPMLTLPVGKLLLLAAAAAVAVAGAVAPHPPPVFAAAAAGASPHPFLAAAAGFPVHPLVSSSRARIGMAFTCIQVSTAR